MKTPAGVKHQLSLMHSRLQSLIDQGKHDIRSKEVEIRNLQSEAENVRVELQKIEEQIQDNKDAIEEYSQQIRDSQDTKVELAAWENYLDRINEHPGRVPPF